LIAPVGLESFHTRAWRGARSALVTGVKRDPRLYAGLRAMMLRFKERDF
jgi:hypothetical protein